MLWGLSVGHRSNARNELKSHSGKKTDTENTDSIVQCVQTRWGCWAAESGRKERGGRQIKDLQKSRVKREAGKGVIKWNKEGVKEMQERRGRTQRINWETKKKMKGKKVKQEESEWTRRRFRRIDAASLHWDGANSAADRRSQVSSRWLMH